MKKMLIRLAMFCLLVVTAAPLFAMNKTDRVLDQFVENYRLRNAAELSKLFAPNIDIDGRQHSRADVQRMHSDLFRSPKNAQIRGIIIIEGRDSFREVSPGVYSGTVTFKVDYTVGGVVKSRNTTLDFTMNSSTGGDKGSTRAAVDRETGKAVKDLTDFTITKISANALTESL